MNILFKESACLFPKDKVRSAGIPQLRCKAILKFAFCKDYASFYAHPQSRKVFHHILAKSGHYRSS